MPSDECIVFLAGSMGIERLDPSVKRRIDNIVESHHSIVIGDADGVDASIQGYLRDHGSKFVTVFCSGPRPRNNLADWPVRSVTSTAHPGTRAYYTAKDIEMAKVADFGLMVWDCKSTGTLSNVIELLKRTKKSVVFANKLKTFITVRSPGDLEELLACMSDSSRDKAERKIGISKQLKVLADQQAQLF